MEVPPTVACHVVAMPYPGRGHINPVLNFCNLLLSHNLDILVTFVVTEEWLGFIGSQAKPQNVQFSTIPNVIPSELDRAADLVGFVEAVLTKMEAPFEQLLDRLEPPPTLIIHDTLLFWVVGVGNRRNIPVASFWTMSASFLSVFQRYHLLEQHGHYPINASEVGHKRVDYFPGISSTRLVDFPLRDGSFSCQRMLQHTSKYLSFVPKAHYLLFPTIHELEPQTIHVLKSEFSLPIYAIGPAIPYYLNVNDQTHLNNSYFQWLDNQPSNSVIYISQGSFLSVSQAQIDEIAAGLRLSRVRFIWVARKETHRLGEICGDVDDKKGLVLEWCEQLRVLMHDAIGGFWSHCGWNSTKEGLFTGVPFLTFPIVMDQHLNSKMIVEDWKVGWRVKKDVDPQRLISRDEIAGLLQKFMDLNDKDGRDMRKRAKELQRVCQLSIANVALLLLFNRYKDDDAYVGGAGDSFNRLINY
ncbi:UDP-glycosyltransferase 87A1-like [Prosopis cineraria]|uniref:UDP-glycosyltransferase 87A1-like n=1 Tax=Prosopis cineraria TaxID=364024 RepID=UPI0024101813|nr:UDP-glycosyltransferase 87A1-like [Prosopis cineraria]